ncbi:MAG: DUF2442 domain-containing protein [Prevotella sp.]|jgi:putative molybdopterin-guanine dinucleotide biosynthesis protein A|uniref:DUF2442 domain-containing protein n=1 Tax=Prevotella veroralis F0319 TaxID=649761 RepID=C9MPA3_9BACT|nr:MULTISPECIES: DUF2442 domain-containing protein [Prevotella]EEX18906.1 hypothetical protein HMPREF0973_01441 [Prevotella veroralis F0319]EID34096.1 PF10387 family protein [Prevotella sp. oral taxon 306 str. F0472]MBF1629656.1 DUF2442 domain-containing protein [Prevotella sp.]QUB40717.1 DUF2442 domain-containing protein [Prevotella veroralis]
MILNITNVEYLGDYSLLCLFNNGKKKRVDLTPLLSYPAFEELKDKSKFIQFGLDGTIFWANGADVSPEYLFDHGVDEA